MTENEFILADRIAKIKSVIEQYREDKCYLSFSGGKDSTVLHKLLDVAVPNNHIKRVYANTGIEYTLIYDFVRQLQSTDDRIIILQPKTPIKAFLEREGYPFKSKRHSEIWQIWNNNHNNKRAIKYRDGLYNFSVNKCPEILKYQFTDVYNGVKLSDKCCYNLKEQPLNEWQKENNIEVAIVGLMRAEGGRRSKTQCMVKYKYGIHFHSLAIVDKSWEEWFIKEYQVKLCDIYYPPYNFERTGCKGCPFNINLQADLDTLQKYFPNERKQCELIWQPVYAEYRRLGYRLRKEEPEITGQMNINDFL